MSVTDYEVIDTETGEVRTNGTAVAVRRTEHQIARREMVGGLLRPVASPEEVLSAQNEVRTLVAKALVKDRDFGVIPGTNKPTLLKPGAERINAAYGIAAEYAVVEKEIDHDRPVSFVKRTWKWGQVRGEKIWTETPGQSEGLYRYVVECRLVHRASGAIVGQGIGSCSTMESKYIDRPRDLENTVLKMASKRAYIAATLNTHGLSDQFTQDIEDNPEAFGAGEAEPARSSNGNGRKASGEKLPTCPKCDGPCWDNRADNEKRKAEGKKPGPAFKCKDKGCAEPIWDWPPKEEDPNAFANEMDRLIGTINSMLRELKRIDPERAAKAESYAEGIIFLPSVTLDQIRQVGGNVKKALQEAEEVAAVLESAEPEEGGNRGFEF